MSLIKYPKKERTEAEVQSLLWYFLRKRKIDARLQVSAYKARLDLVVFVNQEAVCIVECKSWKAGYAATAQYRRNNTKQLNKYRELYGIPVLVCGRANHIDGKIKRIQEILANRQPF